MDPAVADGVIVPVVAADDIVVAERVLGGDGEDVARPGIVIDPEGFIPIPPEDFEGLAAAGPVVFPGVDRKQDAYPAVGVDPDHRHVGIFIALEVDPNPIATLVGVLAIHPYADSWPGGTGAADPAGNQRGGVRGCGGWRDGRRQRSERQCQGAEHDASRDDGVDSSRLSTPCANFQYSPKSLRENGLRRTGPLPIAQKMSISSALDVSR